MSDDKDPTLEAKFQIRSEYESISSTIFWAILSQQIEKKLKTLGTDAINIDLGSPDGPCCASRVQGRHQSLEWLIRVIKDIKDGKISLKKTPS